MSVESSPQRTTLLFARVLGPFLVVVPLTAALRAPQMQTLLADFEANPLWPWVVGAYVLVLGLVVVALHTSWSSPAAVMPHDDARGCMSQNDALPSSSSP